jgi:hypothetical protein
MRVSTRPMYLCLAAGILTATPVSSQTLVPSMLPALETPRRVCPGDPPGNLASVDCSFTTRRRVVDFVGGSVTDQALLGATFFGGVAQIRDQPSQWERNWRGFGQRVGSRYTQNLAKGSTEFLVGLLVRDDPRHVNYASDPLIKARRSGAAPRVGHAVLDWITVRRSSRDGKGRRIPHVSLFAGAVVSGTVGNLWYPEPLTTRSQVARRVASSLATALAASFYHEFGSEIGRVLGAMMKRGRADMRPAGRRKASSR